MSELDFRPATEIPHLYRAYQDGKYMGIAYRCAACEDFVTDSNALNLGSRDEKLNWRCYKCSYIEKRAVPRTAATALDVHIPKEYADASLHELAPKQRRVVEKWPRKIHAMVIGGIPGSGKTRVTWAFVKTAARYGYRITRVDPAVQAAWAGRFNQGDRYAMSDAWQAAGFLILDDLSACNATPAWVTTIHNLITTRELERKPTLITTAGDKETLGQLYNDAIYSRLKSFEWVYLPPIDYRERIAAERAKQELAEAKA